MSKDIERALAALGRSRRATNGSQPEERITAAAFRARVNERLLNVEKQLDEVKGRVNGLLFAVAGAVLVQVLLKVLS